MSDFVTLLPIEARFWAKVSKDPDGCWRWQGAIQSNGYGAFGDGAGRSVLAHRFAYQRGVAPIPASLVLDHLCRNRECVNPAHLEVVTSKVNTLRGLSESAINATKTHCKHGHALSGVNLYVRPNGKRQCRECARAEKLRHYQLSRACPRS